ncbi:MAG TPA: 30S ribosomal protein S2 [Candidatus Megaira endosymbiont of Hartmannula sinica]|nr:30S ribosomal protein S2 [Candidatus Megaera endosymbiont of Hartmannula sinica]
MSNNTSENLDVIDNTSPEVNDNKGNSLVKDLLDAGVHFGHKTFRWNPKMAPYIHSIKNGIHIINLHTTAHLMTKALNKIYDVSRKKGKILFVGSKIQAADIVSRYATDCEQFYVNQRWLGGMMTNWNTVSKSIKRLDNIEKTLDSQERLEKLTKKEILNLKRSRGKLLKAFAGIRKMGGVPDVIVILDTNKEKLAVSEAKTLNIPIIAIVDTNSNPDDINFPIPGNDDAIRSIKLYCELFSKAAVKGKQAAAKKSGVDIGGSKEGIVLEEGKEKKFEQKTSRVNKKD